jgi:hypothetical protein
LIEQKSDVLAREMMEKRKVTFIICTIAVTLLGIASVQIGVNKIVAQEAAALGSADNTFPRVASTPPLMRLQQTQRAKPA